MIMNKQPSQNKLVSGTNSSLKEKEYDLINKNQESPITSRKSDLKEDMTIKTYSRDLVSSWQFWGILLALTFGGVGFTATSVLLKLPTNPNCHKIYLPFSSATNRIYCAQLQAEKKTVEGLLKGIGLLSKLKEDHPLRNQINHYVEEWGNEIIAIGDSKFQEGELDEAIQIARKVPDNSSAYDLVDEKIERWQSIWKRGEEIQAQVEKKLRLGYWNLAFLEAVEMLNIPNNYWKTTKYEEIVSTINLTREESKRLDGAYAALRRKGIDNLLKAIEISSEIDSSSYAYDQALEIIKDAQDEILDYAQNLIDNQRWDSLSALAAKIPADIELRKQSNDWTVLASAGRNSDLGTVSGLELAISGAETITKTSPLYSEAQTLIDTWQLEKEDLAYLADARMIAQPGDVDSLTGAIAKAKLIAYDNPLYREAQREIKDWQRQIETIEDQPYLDQARQLARGNNVNAWQQAINQASMINSNRALYSEAQTLIREWRRNIQREQDQPILNRAVAYGNSGNYQAAIDTANQISSGRFLYGEAQTKIREWRREIKGQNDLNQAYQVAKSNTPQTLLRAINIARGVPSSSTVKGESRMAINRWSEQLLAIARSTANYAYKPSVEEAIRTAELIPFGTSAYNSAREQIASWKSILNPPKPPKPPLEIPPLSPLEVEQTNFSNENQSGI